MAAPLNSRQVLAQQGRGAKQTRANYSGTGAPPPSPVPLSQQFDVGKQQQGVRPALGGTPGTMAPRPQQAPQVRDRRFSQSQAAYQQGAPPAPGMMPLAYIPKQPENTGRVGGLPTNTTGQAREATPLTDLIRTKQFGRAAGGYSARQPDAPQPQQGTPPAAMDVKGGTTVGPKHDPYGGAPQQMAGVAQQNILDDIKNGGQQVWDTVTGGAPEGKKYGPQDGAVAGAAEGGVAVQDERANDPVKKFWDMTAGNLPQMDPWFGGQSPPPEPPPEPSTVAGKTLADVVGAAGDTLAPVVKEINDRDSAAYTDSYDQVYKGLTTQDSIGHDQFGSQARARAEAAAREEMNLGIGTQRNDQMRQLLGMQGRGGAVGQGQYNAVNNSATMAQQAGERGLTQDTYERQRQATQDLLAQLQNTNDRRKSMRDDTFMSTKDLLSMFSEGKDALFGFPGL